MYTKIHDKIWRDLDFRALSDGCKMLYLYLLTCKHRTMLGIYELPVGYICDDLQKGTETVSEQLKDLTETGFVLYDWTNSVVLIPKFLEYNPLDNSNVEKAAVKKVAEIPETALLSDFLNCLETLSKRYKSLIETVSNTETVYRNRKRNSSSTSTPPTPREPPGETGDDPPPEPGGDGGGGLSESEIKDLRRIGEAYEADLGTIPSSAMQDFRRYYLDEKITADVIIKAIRAAAENNARRWAYVRSILDRCVKEKIYTATDWDKNEQRRAGGQGRGGAPPSTQKPDYSDPAYYQQQ